jgi:tetratricopeptide (TPR) repeat protein
VTGLRGRVARPGGFAAARTFLAGLLGLVARARRRLRARLLERLVDRFVECSDWAGAERLVVSRPRLTGDDALVLLAARETAARSLGDHESADIDEYHRLLLERCRRDGPARVFGELSALDPDEDQWVALADAALDTAEEAARSGRVEDLDLAVRRCEQAAGRAVTAPQRSTSYRNLAIVLLRRADRTGHADDVVRAVDLLETLYALTPPHTRDRLDTVTALGWALTQQHRLDHRMPPLDRAVELLERAVSREVTEDPDGPWPSGADDSEALTNLASALRARYFRTGSRDDLRQAVGYFDEAVRYSDRSAPSLGNLGVALSELFVHTGSAEDLSRAEECLREALDAPDPESPGTPARLAHLGAVLTDRYVHHGTDTLDEAVSLFEEAEAATPEDSAERTARSSDLGTVLLTRYERDGDLADLDLAVLSHERAAAGPYYERDDEPLYLDQWGTSLQRRARRTGDAAEARRAVTRHERAVALTESGSPDHALREANHAGALRLYAELSGDGTFLRQAVEVYARVRAAVPDDSPLGGAVLTNHGNALLALAERTGDSAPLDEAIGVLRRAVEVTEPGVPEYASRLCNLGHALISRARDEDAVEAVRVYRDSCRLAERVNAHVRLVAGRAWGAWAARRGVHEEAVEAFGHAADAIGHLVRTQLTRPAAETWLAAATEVSAEAAHAHTALGEPEQAALRLELGRARLLSAALERDRADLRRLRSRHPGLAERYRRAASRLRALETENTPGPGHAPFAERRGR